MRAAASRVAASRAAIREATRAATALAAELKDSVGAGPNHSNLCRSEFGQISVRVQETFSELFRKFEEISTVSGIFGLMESGVKIPRKFHQNDAKFDENC